MGTMANELSLGCDCLGQIHYLVRSAVILSWCYSPLTPRLAWGVYREQRFARRHKECHMYTRGGRRTIVEAYRLSYWGTLVLCPQPSPSDKYGLHPRKLRYAFRFPVNFLSPLINVLYSQNTSGITFSIKTAPSSSRSASLESSRSTLQARTNPHRTRHASPPVSTRNSTSTSSLSASTRWWTASRTASSRRMCSPQLRITVRRRITPATRSRYATACCGSRVKVRASGTRPPTVAGVS